MACIPHCRLIRQAVREGRLATENELVADREKQIDAIIAHPSTVTALENIVVDGQPAIDVLRQQVAELPEPASGHAGLAMPPMRQHRAVVPGGDAVPLVGDREKAGAKR